MRVILIYLFFLFSCAGKKDPSSTLAVPVQKEGEKLPTQEDLSWCQNLHKLIEKYDYKSAITLVEKNQTANVNCRSNFGEIPIISINRTIYSQEAKKLFDAIVNHPKFDAQALNSKGENSLFSSASLEEIKLLVKKGADINQINWVGDTPINIYFFDTSLDKIRYYLDHENYRKNQPSLNNLLHHTNDIDTLAFAIERGALVSFDKDNQSPLFRLLGDSPEKKARLILEQARKQGFDLREFINHKRIITSGLNPIYDGDTALHEAVRLYIHYKNTPPHVSELQSPKWENVIKLMLSNGADPKIKNKANESAEDLVKNAGYDLPSP